MAQVLERLPRHDALPGAGALSVGVLVDLMWTPEAGGHVKCWEQFARAAAAVPERLDLTLHLAGERERIVPLAPNVRLHLTPPVFSTERLLFLAESPDHSDLAPFHPRLARLLPRYDVLHATDAYFAFARTALRVSRCRKIPLVASTHTDTPKYSRIFARNGLRRLLGNGWLAAVAIERLRIPDRIAARMERRLTAFLARCDAVLASSEEDLARARAAGVNGPIRRLRRGIDQQFFHPRWRDRRWLAESWGIPADRFLLLFVGRLDESKSPLLLAEAAHYLLQQGVPVHVFAAGRGRLRGGIEALLGPHATCPGPLPPETLRRVYASADLFVFPSTTEISPNVVIEAKSSGLPVVLSTEGGSRQMLRRDGEDGVLVPSREPSAWAAAVEALYRNPERREAMGVAARYDIATRWPSWEQVLLEDLLPVWEEVRRCTSGAAVSPTANGTLLHPR